MGEHLERDAAIHALLPGLVDDSHAAAADASNEAIVAQYLTAVVRIVGGR